MTQQTPPPDRVTHSIHDSQGFTYTLAVWDTTRTVLATAWNGPAETASQSHLWSAIRCTVTHTDHRTVAVWLLESVTFQPMSSHRNPTVMDLRIWLDLIGASTGMWRYAAAFAGWNRGPNYVELDCTTSGLEFLLGPDHATSAGTAGAVAGDPR